MADRQTRIFVPFDEPARDWAETLLGRIVHPLTVEFAGVLGWFWFSRYACRSIDDIDDCDITKIPSAYKQPFSPDDIEYHRSLRLRYQVEDNALSEFEGRAKALIDQHKYCISDFREFDVVAGLTVD